MYRLLAVVAAGLVGGAFAPAALASNGVMKVDDHAGAFTADGIKAAKDRFAGTTFNGSVHLTVVTVGAKDVPGSLKADLEKAISGKDSGLMNRVMSDWAREEELKQREKGVFVLIYTQGTTTFARVKADRSTDKYRGFTDKDAERAAKTIVEDFKAGKGKDPAAAQAAHDQALIHLTGFVIDQLKDTSAPATTGAGNGRQAVNDRANAGGGTSVGSYICLGLCVLLGVWLVIGLVRAFTGGGGGYGPGGYGGGGGGGFFPSLIGGMFGAAAGMWLYDSFFRDHSSAAASDAGGGYGGNDGTGDGDFDRGSEGGAGDFGNDADGGGDYGGGDYGGGDFGGGDFGGGGGDFGGGGGDW
jgi:uncharacterized protein